MTAILAEPLSKLYDTYNRREFVHPDPLEFLYPYEDIKDREIVGLVASSLAYGSVFQILKSVAFVLKKLNQPHRFIQSASLESLLATFQDFKYRFTTGEELAYMLYGISTVIEHHGSLSSCFVRGLHSDHETVLPALSAFVGELVEGSCHRVRTLLPSPCKGSACKRLNLFLRWMVRCDDVDPGGWDIIPPSKLVVPLDIHMHRISLRLGLTKRKQADLKTATEITSAFGRIVPADPVRYDFSLTRLGIRDELTPDGFIHHCRNIACE